MVNPIYIVETFNKKLRNNLWEMVMRCSILLYAVIIVLYGFLFPLNAMGKALYGVVNRIYAVETSLYLVVK